MIYMFLENGFEETEAIATLDLILRAGIEIKTVGKTDMVEGSHGIGIRTDLTYDKITKENLAGIILPGGLPGTTNLEANETVKEYIMYCFENKLLLAAICAAPSIFGKLGLLSGKKAVAYPSFQNELKEAIVCDNELAVADNNIITGKAMGGSLEFGKKIISYLVSEEKAKEIMDSIYA